MIINFGTRSNKKKQTTKKAKLNGTIRALALLIISIGAIVALGVITKSPESQAAPFTSCNSNGILFQYPGNTNTQVHLIDMASGHDSYPSNPIDIPNRTINAIGYNARDHYIYGWDNTNDTLVRIHADWSVEPLTITGLPALASSSIIIGDVDENGLYWFIDGNGHANGETVYAIDVTVPGTTVTIEHTRTTSGIPANHGAGADWAYVPGGTGLYRVMHDDTNNQGRLLVFDRDTGAFSSVGTGLISQAQLPHSGLTEGAFYADAAGHLYASSNTSGDIYRINLSGPSAAFFASGPSSGSNDGARCVDAAVHVDYGDAPDDYDTLLGSNGARHSVVNYIEASHTAPLMLGNRIDTENDGLPNARANGDDTNDANDERGVQHIVIEQGVLTGVEVQVRVTNDTSTDAVLAGWIDSNNNNTFETGERATLTIPANSGFRNHTLVFPDATYASNTYARFRLFSDPSTVTDPQPVGAAATPGGEVEDHLVQMGAYDVNKTADPADGSMVNAGQTVTYTITIDNTGSTSLTDLKIDDDLSDVLDDATLEGTPTVSPASAGTASVEGNTLEFTSDTINAGQTVTVTYAVKIKDAGSLGSSNGTLNNAVIAAHSASCHPDVSSGSASVSNDNCKTQHSVPNLADTGSKSVILGSAIALLSIAVVLRLSKQSPLASRNQKRS